MLWQCSQQEGEKAVAYFDSIDSLCTQADNLTGAGAVVEVVRKNFLLSY